MEPGIIRAIIGVTVITGAFIALSIFNKRVGKPKHTKGLPGYLKFFIVGGGIVLLALIWTAGSEVSLLKKLLFTGLAVYYLYAGLKDVLHR